MIANLTFDLDSSEDRDAFMRATLADDLYRYAFDLDEYVRRLRRDGEEITLDELFVVIGHLKTEAVMVAMDYYR